MQDPLVNPLESMVIELPISKTLTNVGVFASSNNIGCSVPFAPFTFMLPAASELKLINNNTSLCFESGTVNLPAFEELNVQPRLEGWSLAPTSTPPVLVTPFVVLVKYFTLRYFSFSNFGTLGTVEEIDESLFLIVSKCAIIKLAAIL